MGSNLVQFGLVVLLLGLECSAHILRPNIESRIINGSDAEPENARHQVSIRIRDEDSDFGKGHTCGGSIIAPTVVLTAAHCLFNLKTFKYDIPARSLLVTMGSLDLFDSINSLSFNVTYYTKHAFDVFTLENDVALLFLDGTIPLDLDNIKPIELMEERVLDDTNCRVYGWGATETEKVSRRLQVVDVPIVNEESCAKSYELEYVKLKPGMICAGYPEGGKAACKGDSGGPLVCNGKLAGIVSWSVGCALPGYPAVYSDVSYYYNWIQKESRGNGSQRGQLSLVLLVSVLIVRRFV